jgi:tRNA (Thr-GGU) A37 N-methylase
MNINSADNIAGSPILDIRKLLKRSKGISVHSEVIIDVLFLDNDNIEFTKTVLRTLHHYR